MKRRLVWIASFEKCGRARSLLTLAAVGGVALTLAACGGGKGTGGNPGGSKYANGKTFTMILGADPGNLDPHFTSLASTLETDRFLYDSLVNLDASGKMVAGLAERWEGTTTSAKYVLRKGVTCSDGTPLTAKVVADNINFVGDPKNASSRMGVFVPPGATATADDATGTVSVTSPAPNSFLDRTVGGLQIVCDKGMKDRTILQQGASGTGMFTLTEAVANDHYTLSRRKDYAWGPGDWKTDQVGLPDKVILKIVGNESTSANLLLSDQANAALIVGPDRQRLQAAKLFQREVVATLGELWFNHKAGLPGADEAVRRALTQALNLTELGKVLTSGSGKPTTGLVAPGLGPCEQNTIGDNLPKSDIEAAKKALDAAGWTPSAGGIRVKGGQKLTIAVLYPTSVGAGMQATAELAQKVWSGIGAEVTLKAVSDAEVGTVIVGGQGSWDATFLPLNVTLPSELTAFLSGPSAPNGVNFSSIANAVYDASVQAASAVAGTAGCDKWAAAEVALFKHVDMVPFVNSAVPTFAKGAEFELTGGGLSPQSVRMLA
jgi:peptide/nickel transport system substrate-binding protein